MFPRDSRLSACESAGHEISTIVDKLMPETYDIPHPSSRKAAWKVALWAPHRRRAASRGGGGFDLVIACREEWEMSPGGERTDLRQVGESTASLFCSGPTTAHESPGLDRSRGVISPPRRRERVLQTDRCVSPRKDVSPWNKITSPKKCLGVGKKKRVCWQSRAIASWKSEKREKAVARKKGFLTFVSSLRSLRKDLH